MRHRKLLLLALASSFFLISCTPIEKTAYRTVVASKAFLDSVKKVHTECTNPATVSKVCTLLVQATAAKDLLIDAGEVYCSGGSFSTGGACNAPKKGSPGYQTALDKLTAALSLYEQTEKDLKSTIQGGVL